MIILSGVLVVAAIALLVAGIVAGNGDSAQVFGLDALVVIYISIAVSIVSALCLAIGVFLRRKELFGTGTPAAPARKGKAKRPRPAPPVPAAKSAAGAPAASRPSLDAPAEPDDEVEIPVQPVDVPDGALVFVVRGRKRYHLDTCRQLAGRDTEELTYAEAKEEGFSPCTACMPDTALAARAAASGPGSPDPGRTVADGSDLTKPDFSKPGLTKPGLTKPGLGGPRVDRSAPGPEGGLAGLAKTSPASPHAAPHPAPAPFGPTAEIPRVPEPGEPEHDRPAAERREEPPAGRVPSAWSSSPADPDPEPEAPAPFRSPAGPTLTDIPVTGPSRREPERAEEPAVEPQAAGEPEPEPEAAPAPERPAAAGSAPTDVTADFGDDPLNLGAAAAPRPRDADDAAVSEHAAPAADEQPASDGYDEPAGDGYDEPAGDGYDEPAGDGYDEPAEPEDADDGPQVRILSGTKRYHRTDCALIEDIGDEADDLEALSRAEAKARGCTPCLVCQPDREHARD
ncbi:hypothetical protein F8568_028895 [Actinomadura sp. LD22]|uniref:Uncharacterized protein n=1 Tax=Actinomadura physcomitrii TaxID=2650748 RepID=A0A6I4MIA8_9ACTN|nr:hypothetical protein [Actinomadura physcomitrii]MWA04325.1 hypothetical protein [Actinomadura physcomitrii]